MTSYSKTQKLLDFVGGLHDKLEKYSRLFRNFYFKYGYIRKKKAEKLAIKHQYELKLSDTARTINEDANMNIGIYRHEFLNG